MNYFALFEFPRCYFLDEHLLKARYQALQRQYHPDKYSCHTPPQRLAALHQAAMINDAYQTLKHPLARAEYLLSLQGIDLKQAHQTLGDKTFLMEQLDLREELDAIKKTADIQIGLTHFMSRLMSMMQKQTTTMQEAFKQQNWAEAADTVRKLYFFDKLRQIVEEELFEDALPRGGIESR